jgi:streptogramin lyase
VLARVAAALVVSAVAIPGATAAGDAAPVRIVARIDTGAAPCTATSAFGAVWVVNLSNGDVVRVSPKTNHVLPGRIRVGPEPCGLAAGAGSLWIDGYGSNRILRVNPRTRKVIARIRVGGHP